MKLFQKDGHLTDAALAALIQGETLEELTQLEISEHLSFCDRCLQRYIIALENAPLLTPSRSCRDSLWRRIRQRTLHLLTSRYATAVAAVTLALTLLWGGDALPISLPEYSEEHPSLSTWWNTSLDGATERLQTLFDNFELDWNPPRKGMDK